MSEMSRRDFLTGCAGLGLGITAASVTLTGKDNHRVLIMETEYGYINIHEDRHVRAHMTKDDILSEIASKRSDRPAWPMNIRVRPLDYNKLVENWDGVIDRA